jgi:hypothetical protein
VKYPRYQFQPGQTFGLWTVVRFYTRATKSRALARCQCGTERELSARKLAIGLTKSCGCANARLGGRSASKAYATWVSRMRDNLLCPEWRDSRVYLDYVEALPGYGVPGARLTRIKLRFPFRPGNVEWRVKGKPAASTQS